MSDYDLSLTGAQIDSALSKVHNADTQPTNGSANVVTSDGVFDAVNDIQFANLNNNLVKTNISSGTNNTTLPSSEAVKSYVDSQVGYFLWARTQMNMTSQTGGLTWSNTIKHSSFTGFSTSGQQITIPTGTYFINVTWTNVNESSSYAYANWYLMEGSQSGTQIFKGRIGNSTDSQGSSVIISGGNYFMKLVDGYVTGTVYVNVLKIAQ